MDDVLEDLRRIRTVKGSGVTLRWKSIGDFEDLCRSQDSRWAVVLKKKKKKKRKCFY